MEILIREYLTALNGGNLVFVPNPGNGGDCVIASGTFQIFDEIDLQYKIFNVRETDVKNSILIYAGGGNLVKPSTYSAQFVGKYHKQAKRFVLLPHTIKEVDNLLDEMGRNVDLICREVATYNYARAQAKNANVYLAEDMAFGLNAHAFLQNFKVKIPYSIPSYIFKRYIQNQLTPSWAELGRMLSYKSRFAEAQKKIVRSEIQAFRLDGESARNGELPKDNIDLSAIFTFGATTRAGSDFATYLLLSVLSQCKTVNTDRLHIAISAALLGINVNLHANNYYKIREIYLYSLKDKYPNVNWISN